MVQRQLIREAMKRQDRSYSWLASKVTVVPASKQNVADWLDEERPRTPRNPLVFADMLAALGVELTDPKIPAGFKVPKIRLAGEVPAGDWGDPLASEEFIEIADSRFDHPMNFAAHVVGNSCWPYLQPKDLTIWRKDNDPPYYSFILAQRKGDHGCTLKELVRDEKQNRPVLQSPNPDYGNPEDGEGWGAIARLVGVIFEMEGVSITVEAQKGITRKKLSFRQKMFDVS